MRKIVISLFGILLLPCVAGLATAIYQLVISVYMHPEAMRILNHFLIGAAIWFVLFILFPRPVRSYIFAHELSHLLAAWMSGVKGGALEVHADGGSVEVEKTTLWISLAPYMIPLYSLGLIGCHYLAGLWWDPQLWLPLLPFGLGLTWSFHLCFTLYILMHPQSDVQPYGLLGAYSMILAVNLLLLCAALFVINGETLRQDLHLLLQQQKISYRFSAEVLHQLFSLIKNAIIQG
ncbi:hypothetical protein P0Y35_02480 [Kiritimatiellaeota bacterium B1221]|nr:hypothetical protein [Kiritimatiellaeota bacterium B1221]